MSLFIEDNGRKVEIPRVVEAAGLEAVERYLAEPEKTLKECEAAEAARLKQTDAPASVPAQPITTKPAQKKAPGGNEGNEA